MFELLGSTLAVSASYFVVFALNLRWLRREITGATLLRHSYRGNKAQVLFFILHGKTDDFMLLSAVADKKIRNYLVLNVTRALGQRTS